MTTTILYARRSTDLQANSIEVQTQALLAWAAREGVVTSLMVETESGSSTAKRPVLQSIFGLVRTGLVKTLVVTKLDRAFRDEIDALATNRELLARHGCRLISLAEGEVRNDAAGQLSYGMFSLVAAFERRRLAERTIEALAIRRQQGQYLGAVPAGFVRTGTTITPDEGKMALVRRIFALAQAGLSSRQIAARLTADGVPTTRGEHKPWVHTSIIKILKNERYTNL